MIDKKKISKASAAHAKATWNHDEEQFACMDGFGAGANWAIEEFLQNLWKGPEIEPKPNSDIITISEKNMSHVFRDMGTPNWKYLMKFHDVDRWCYLDDILPQKGGED